MIGDLIRQRRQELGMSQDELAKKVGFKDRSSITKIEKNETDVNQTMLKRISDALEVEPLYFIKPAMEFTPYPSDEISPRVEAYIEKFLKLSADKQDAIGKYIDFMAREDGDK